MTKLAAPQQGPASERLLPLTAPSPEDELSGTVGTVGTRWGHEDADHDHRRDISRSPNERLNHPTHFTTRYDRAGPHPKVSPITQQQYMQKKLVKSRGYHLQPPSFNTEDISPEAAAASTENKSNARHLDSSSSEVPSHSRMSRSPYSPPPPPDPPDIRLAPTGDSSPQRVTPNASDTMDPGSDTVPPVSRFTKILSKKCGNIFSC